MSTETNPNANTSVNTSVPTAGADCDVGLNEFARRHTARSRFSHYAGTELEFLKLTAACLPHAKAGPADGILKVPLPTAGFFSGVVLVTDRMGLAAQWVRRRPGEDPHIAFSVPDARKAPATGVEVIVYRRDVLGTKASTDRTWEVVSLNARSDPLRPGQKHERDEPMHPLAMARNFLNKPGGTPLKYTEAQFAESILYWSCRAMCGEEEKDKVLTGPEFPPLWGSLCKPDDGSPYLMGVCEDWTFLAPPPARQPRLPIKLAERYAARVRAGYPPESLVVGFGGGDAATELAESIYYWSARPVPPQEANSGPS